MTTWSCIPESRDWLGRTPGEQVMASLDHRRRERARAKRETPIFAELAAKYGWSW